MPPRDTGHHPPVTLAQTARALRQPSSPAVRMKSESPGFLICSAWFCGALSGSMIRWSSLGWALACRPPPSMSQCGRRHLRARKLAQPRAWRQATDSGPMRQATDSGPMHHAGHGRAVSPGSTGAARVAVGRFQLQYRQSLVRRSVFTAVFEAKIPDCRARPPVLNRSSR